MDETQSEPRTVGDLRRGLVAWWDEAGNCWDGDGNLVQQARPLTDWTADEIKAVLLADQYPDGPPQDSEN